MPYEKVLELGLKSVPWLIITICLAIGINKVSGIIDERNQLRSDFANFRAEHERIVTEQQNKHKIAYEVSKLKLTNAIAKYENINAKLLRKLNEKNNVINGLSTDVEQLQNSLRASLIARSQNTSDTITTTEGWRDAYATVDRQYRELSVACGITTNQYNLLRTWADEACTLVNCSE